MCTNALSIVFAVDITDCGRGDGVSGLPDRGRCFLDLTLAEPGTDPSYYHDDDNDYHDDKDQHDPSDYDNIHDRAYMDVAVWGPLRARRAVAVLRGVLV